ncbi:MAG: triose-phosphate isomerase [Anaerolineales bacterium]|nr:triose-phosphate isomerase [Anaerolineales bacterium]
MATEVKRRPCMAANWKMNKTSAEGAEFVRRILPGLKEADGVERVICPPAAALPALADLLKGSGIGLGAQNMHWEPKGAFTGELSAAMVKEWCNYVILGHSERRGLFGETDEMVAKKVKAALAAGLMPIICVGETLAENEAGQTDAVVRRQMNAAFDGLTPDQAGTTIVAYEPVWAIGTGRAAHGPDANKVIAGSIRSVLTERFGNAVAQAVRVLYGGSVTPDNIAEFLSEPEIDGGLVGGASLKPEYVEVVKAALKRIK